MPSSRTWDIGGPDVLEYGDMMRVYAEVAGLRKRYLIVLPFLTPTIASLWVGTVTPIPPGLARPLIESLECDAVMRDSDIDTIIEPPPGGLTGYRRAVALALNRAVRGLPDATWASLESEPAEPLPSDPDWAGEIVYTDVRTAVTAARPDDVWKAAETAANGSGRWSVAEREPATLRLRDKTVAGQGVVRNHGHAARRRRQQVHAAGDFFAGRHPGPVVLVCVAAASCRRAAALARDVVGSAGVRPRTTAATRAP